MKRFAILLLLGGLLAAVPSCIYIDDDHPPFFDCEEGFGPQVTRELFVPEFSNVALTISADLILAEGPDPFVEAKGEENIIDLIERDVHNDTWEIEFERCVRNHDHLQIFATMPFFEEIVLSGSGDINSANTLTNTNFDLVLTGSGEIDLDLETFQTDAVISGSGDIELTGISDDLDLTISGSGDFDSFGLESKTASIQITGSGSVELTVTETLNVVISGSGSVFFKGNPQLNVTITGSGQVVDAN